MFDELGPRLRTLLLHDNDLSSLPPRIFEKLTNLTAGDLSLAGNPGSARFVPIAKAGPQGGFDVASGDSVTLGVDGAENGFDDPWGDNVEYEWTPPAGTTVTYTDDTTANSPRPSFTAPTADGTLTFTLTVTGNGGSFAATSSVDVRVVAAVIHAADAGECDRERRDPDADLR